MNSNYRANDIATANRRLAATNLKQCPVCDALNSAQNLECFVCSWHGQFSHDPADIEAALIQLLRRCPEFRIPVPAAPTFEPTKKVSKWKLLLRKVLRGRLDFRV